MRKLFVAAVVLTGSLVAPASAAAAWTISDVTVIEGEAATLTFTDDGPADRWRLPAWTMSPDGMASSDLWPRDRQTDPNAVPPFALDVGERQTTYTYETIDDDEDETDERFTVELTGLQCRPVQCSAYNPYDTTLANAGSITILDNDEPSRPVRPLTCHQYMRQRIGKNLRYATGGLRYFGLRAVIGGTGRGGLFTYLCGDGKATATVKHRGVTVAKGTLKGVYDDFVKARGPIKLRPTAAAGRLRGLAKAKLSVTITLFSADGRRVSKTRKVTVTAAGTKAAAEAADRS